MSDYLKAKYEEMQSGSRFLHNITYCKVSHGLGNNIFLKDVVTDTISTWNMPVDANKMEGAGVPSFCFWGKDVALLSYLSITATSANH